MDAAAEIVATLGEAATMAGPDTAFNEIIAGPKAGRKFADFGPVNMFKGAQSISIYRARVTILASPTSR